MSVHYVIVCVDPGVVYVDSFVLLFAGLMRDGERLWNDESVSNRSVLIATTSC